VENRIGDADYPPPRAKSATLSRTSWLLHLRHNQTKLIFTRFMTSEPNVAHLRTLRKRSGLSQKELGHILGFRSGAPISRHERSDAVPDLLTAFGYEAIFRVPISELFPGLYQAVEVGIEERLAEIEDELQQSTAKGREAVPVARKLEFFCERKNPESNNTA
jgi:transcriptional regulator with XRE-family HTH domain